MKFAIRKKSAFIVAGETTFLLEIVDCSIRQKGAIVIGASVLAQPYIDIECGRLVICTIRGDVVSFRVRTPKFKYSSLK